jgi:pyruvate dehydrogenase (quinone)
MLCDTIAKALAAPGPAVVDVIADPTEIPSMPHVNIDQVWKFGIGKLYELVGL